MALITYNPVATFIHTPKCGGNSFKVWLLQNNIPHHDTKGSQHATIERVKEKYDGDLGITWSIVRNPWDYLVSWYTFKVMLAKDAIKHLENAPHLHREVVNNRKDEKWNIDIQRHNLEVLEKGFENWLFKNNRKPQSHWSNACDVVLRLENINEEFKWVQDMYNCYQPLQKENKSKDRKDYRSY